MGGIVTASQFALLGFGPIATALTIFGLIVVRGTKVSEFRQAWINDQRADIGKLLSAARRLANGGGNKATDYWLIFDEAATRIALRKNPENAEWEDVLVEITDLRTRLTAATETSPATIAPPVEKIEVASRKWLKTEWKRVRSGEMGYKALIMSGAILVFWPVMPLIGFGIFHLLGLAHLLPAGLQIEAFLPETTK
jgi:hypothetical protein